VGAVKHFQELKVEILEAITELHEA